MLCVRVDSSFVYLWLGFPNQVLYHISKTIMNSLSSSLTDIARHSEAEEFVAGGSMSEQMIVLHELMVVGKEVDNVLVGLRPEPKLDGVYHVGRRGCSTASW